MERVVLVSQADSASIGASVLLYLLPAVFLAMVTVYAWQRRQIAAAVPLHVLLAAVVFWSVCHAASMASTTLPSTLRWAQVQYAGIVLIGPLWLLFVLAYRNRWGAMGWVWYGALLLPAALSFSAVLTNDWHGLWWPTVALDRSRPFGSLAITHGALFWLHSSYSYGCVLLGCALLVPAMRSRAPNRAQARLLAASVLFPLVGSLAHVFGLRTTAVDDPTPVLFAISGVLIAYAALRYRFLDPAPVTAQELLEGLPDGLVVLEPPDIVAALNAAAPRLLDAHAGNWVGQPLLPHVTGSPLEPALRALLTDSSPPPSNHAIASEPARVARTVELRLWPLHTRGKHHVLIVRDYAATIQQEQAQSEPLAVAQAAQTPTQIAMPPALAVVAHELRSPLTSIIGYTDLLERGTFGTLPPRSAEALARIRHSGVRLMRLITDMLDVARLETGDGAVECAPTDLNAVIGDAVAAMHPQIQQRGLALRVELAPQLPLVQANRERLEQVLINLLTNAIKFTDRGAITVRTVHDGAHVAFSVADTGIGIPPDQQHTIFQAFQQIDNEHTHRAPGTGLGLAISQRLMEAMGGALRVESTPGVGSTFHGELAITGDHLATREHGST